MGRSHGSDENEILDEQVPHHGIAEQQRAERLRRPTMLNRIIGDRDEDRTLRRAVLVVSLLIGLISLTGTIWRAGTQINALVSTLQRVGPGVDSLGKQVRDLGTSVVVLNSRVDTLSARESRRDATDSARFAALEKATAAVNHATAAIARRSP